MCAWLRAYKIVLLESFYKNDVRLGQYFLANVHFGEFTGLYQQGSITGVPFDLLEGQTGLIERCLATEKLVWPTQKIWLNSGQLDILLEILLS